MGFECQKLFLAEIRTRTLLLLVLWGHRSGGKKKSGAALERDEVEVRRNVWCFVQVDVHDVSVIPGYSGPISQKAF